MKKILISLIGLIFLINLIGVVSAITNEDASYYYKHGLPFNISRECFFNGAYCNSTLFMCFITVYAPNGTNILNNSQMTGAVNTYYKQITATDWPNGLYRSSMACADGVAPTATNYGSEIFYFIINPTGDNRSLTLFLVLGLTSFIVLGFGILFQNEYIGFIAGALFIVTGVYVMIYGFANLADGYTQAIAYTSIGLGFIFEIAAGYKVAEETNISEVAGGIYFKDGFE